MSDNITFPESVIDLTRPSSVWGVSLEFHEGIASVYLGDVFVGYLYCHGDQAIFEWPQRATVSDGCATIPLVEGEPSPTT